MESLGNDDVSIDRFYCHATKKKKNWKQSSRRSQENEML